MKNFSPSDTICTPVTTYQKLVIASNERNSLKEQLDLTNQRIEGFMAEIRLLRSKDSVTVSTYEAQLKTMNDEKNILMDAIADKNQEIKKWRHKLFWSQLGGAVGLSIMGYLYITK